MIRVLLIVVLAALLFVAAGEAGRPQPARIRAVSQQVFDASHWRTAACIAHYESTDGAHLYNGTSLGPWQINVPYHPWVNKRRVVSDWLYAARVAYRISSGGRDWSAWTTHQRCGV
jgi:hypothetical protein